MQMPNALVWPAAVAREAQLMFTEGQTSGGAGADGMLCASDGYEAIIQQAMYNCPPVCSHSLSALSPPRMNMCICCVPSGCG
jgi:hypothetical protein